jgi:hypothetical protein
MNSQSKIAGTLLIGLALGAALGALLYYLKQDDTERLGSDADGQAAANAADEWSDLNDSLGG